MIGMTDYAWGPLLASRSALPGQRCHRSRLGGPSASPGLESHRSCDFCDFPMAPEVGAEKREGEPIGAAGWAIEESAGDEPAKQLTDVGDVSGRDAQIG